MEAAVIPRNKQMLRTVGRDTVEIAVAAIFSYVPAQLNCLPSQLLVSKHKMATTSFSAQRSHQRHIFGSDDGQQPRVCGAASATQHFLIAAAHRSDTVPYWPTFGAAATRLCAENINTARSILTTAAASPATITEFYSSSICLPVCTYRSREQYFG